MSQKGAVPLPILIAVIGIISFIAITRFAPFRGDLISTLFPKDKSQAVGAFLDTFNGNPSTPQPFINDPSSAIWDVAVQSRDSGTWETLEEMDAHHGPDCGSPLDASGNLVTHHQTGSYEQSVFKCKDHVMTSLNAGGYGVIYLTPNQIVDFTDGEAVIKVDVTTLRTSGRDWWDIWITPYDENLQLPFNMGDVDLNGVPKNAVQIVQNNANGSGSGFAPAIYKNFQATDDFKAFSGDFNWWTGYETFMKTSPKQRTTFELRISKNHLKFGIPAGQLDEAGQPINGGQAFWWVDKDITPLDWTQGIIQFGHHSYNPQKDCTPDPSKKSCYPNTWHWDTVSISNSTPFTIIKADKRMISNNNGTLTFNSPAPADSFMRFSAIGTVEYSLNDGASWTKANKQPSSTINDNTYHYEHLTSYFVPIPEGSKQVQFRFSQDNWYTGPYQAKDFAIWSQSTSSTPVSPSPSATASISPSPSPSASAAASPSPSPSPRKIGDIDGNNKVDIFDYNQILTDFGKTGTGLISDIETSGSSLNKVDIFDFNTVLSNFGR